MKAWQRLVDLSQRVKKRSNKPRQRQGKNQKKVGQAVHTVPKTVWIDSHWLQRGQKTALIALYCGLIVGILYINQQLWLSDQRGYREVKRLELALEQQREHNARLLARNDQLRHEVISLKQGADAMEERARYDLGMIREGETLIQLVPE